MEERHGRVEQLARLLPREDVGRSPEPRRNVRSGGWPRSPRSSPAARPGRAHRRRAAPARSTCSRSTAICDERTALRRVALRTVGREQRDELLVVLGIASRGTTARGRSSRPSRRRRPFPRPRPSLRGRPCPLCPARAAPPLRRRRRRPGRVSGSLTRQLAARCRRPSEWPTSATRSYPSATSSAWRSSARPLDRVRARRRVAPARAAHVVGDDPEGLGKLGEDLLPDVLPGAAEAVHEHDRLTRATSSYQVRTPFTTISAIAPSSWRIKGRMRSGPYNLTGRARFRQRGRCRGPVGDQAPTAAEGVARLQSVRRAGYIRPLRLRKASRWRTTPSVQVQH